MTKKASELLADSAVPFDEACLIAKDNEDRLEAIKELLDQGFNDSDSTYDLQAVNQAHRIASGGDYPKETKSLPNGWGLLRHEPGKIVVSHKDGSGVVIKEDGDSIAEIIFYRIMDQILTRK